MCNTIICSAKSFISFPMGYLLTVVALLVTASAIGILHLVSRAKQSCPANLPPGSFGLPVIGQTLVVLRAWRANGLDRLIRDWVDRYGPVSKASLLCTPAVLLSGPAATKFLFFSSLLRPRMPRSFHRIFGEKSIMDLHGVELKPYVGRVDAKVRHHLEENWCGRTTVTALPLMRRLTIHLMAPLLFGLELGAAHEDLVQDFVRIGEGMIAIPANLPFTAFRRSIEVSRRARQLLDEITHDKKAKLVQGELSPSNDIITRLLSLTDDHGDQLLTNDEIVGNCLFVLVAGYDSTALLITSMLRHLANDPATLADMLQEHEEIARNKAAGEALTWEDLSRMKFTWQVAQEALRINPPSLVGSRKAFEDIEFEGYCIPKGWQVYWVPYLTHMDPNIFNEPAKFDPSRFGSQSSVMPPCSFVPFGGGPRLCPGIEFIKIETLVTMHNLVRKFRWKLCCNQKTFGTDPMKMPLDAMQIELEYKVSL